MPTKKIADLPGCCRHPEHLPPMHQVFEPGIYEHECPACHKKTTFVVNGYFCWQYKADPLFENIPQWPPLENKKLVCEKPIPGQNSILSGTKNGIDPVWTEKYICSIKPIAPEIRMCPSIGPHF
jgi:hypothetical protein